MEASPVVAARNPFRFDGPPAFPLRRSAAACPLFRFDGLPRPARFSASTVRCGPSLFEKRRNSSILGEFLRYACNSCKNMSKYPSQKQKNNWGGQSYGG